MPLLWRQLPTLSYLEWSSVSHLDCGWLWRRTVCHSHWNSELDNLSSCFNQSLVTNPLNLLCFQNPKQLVIWLSQGQGCQSERASMKVCTEKVQMDTSLTRSCLDSGPILFKIIYYSNSQCWEGHFYPCGLHRPACISLCCSSVLQATAFHTSRLNCVAPRRHNIDHQRIEHT